MYIYDRIINYTNNNDTYELFRCLKYEYVNIDDLEYQDTMYCALNDAILIKKNIKMVKKLLKYMPFLNTDLIWEKCIHYKRRDICRLILGKSLFEGKINNFMSFMKYNDKFLNYYDLEKIVKPFIKNILKFGDVQALKYLFTKHTFIVRELYVLHILQNAICNFKYDDIIEIMNILVKCEKNARYYPFSQTIMTLIYATIISYKYEKLCYVESIINLLLEHYAHKYLTTNSKYVLDNSQKVIELIIDFGDYDIYKKYDINCFKYKCIIFSTLEPIIDKYFKLQKNISKLANRLIYDNIFTYKKTLYVLYSVIARLRRSNYILKMNNQDIKIPIDIIKIIITFSL